MTEFPMISFEEAQRIVLEAVPTLGTEKISLAQAAGRVLGQSIVAKENLPLLPTATVDGFALAFEGDTLTFRIVGEIAAGHFEPLTLSPGTAVRIMTGAVVPPGAEAVAMVEHTTEDNGIVRLHRPPSLGENISPIGSDVQAGQTVLEKGTVLGPAEIGLLAAVGATEFAVHRQPRVGVLSTGDELVEPDVSPPAGAVRDSNRYALMAAIEEAGGIAVDLGIARDSTSYPMQRIKDALAQVDILLTSGGVSRGAYDWVKPALAQIGQIHFGSVATKPGKPLTFATSGDKQLFGLPGFPVSSLVTFELYVRPAMLKMQGRHSIHRPTIRVLTEESLRPDAERLEFKRAVAHWTDGRLWARTTGPQASSRLLSLAGANALLVIPAGTAPIEEGTEVNAILIGELHNR